MTTPLTWDPFASSLPVASACPPNCLLAATPCLLDLLCGLVLCGVFCIVSVPSHTDPSHSCNKSAGSDKASQYNNKKKYDRILRSSWPDCIALITVPIMSIFIWADTRHSQDMAKTWPRHGQVIAKTRHKSHCLALRRWRFSSTKRPSQTAREFRAHIKGLIELVCPFRVLLSSNTTVRYEYASAFYTYVSPSFSGCFSGRNTGCC